MSRYFLPCLMVAVVSSLLPGCQDPEAAVALSHRQRNIERTLGAFRDRERATEERLAYTLHAARQCEEAHAAKFDADMVRLDRLARQDSQQWREKQPLFQEWCDDMLQGDDEAMTRAFLAMFY